MIKIQNGITMKRDRDALSFFNRRLCKSYFAPPAEVYHREKTDGGSASTELRR